MKKSITLLAYIASLLAGYVIGYYSHPKDSTLTVHTSGGHPYVATLSRPMASEEIFLEDSWNNERVSFYTLDSYLKGLSPDSRKQETDRINKKIWPNGFPKTK